MTILLTTVLVVSLSWPAFAQEARRRWEMERQIRLDKFETESGIQFLHPANYRLLVIK